VHTTKSTTAMPQYRKEIGNPASNLDMGNFNSARLTMGQLRQIYFWARDEIGVRAMAGYYGGGRDRRGLLGHRAFAPWLRFHYSI
jgi:hypothetical protein